MRYVVAISAMLVASAVTALSDATLTVIHGIDGLPAPVEVTANGNSLGQFDFNEQFGPFFELPAGDIRRISYMRLAR